MKVQTKQVGNVVVAQLVGEIDTVDREGFQEALSDLAATKPGSLVLDMSGVTYIASVGLSLLLKLAQDMRKARRALVIAAVTPAVQTVLDTVPLGGAIPIVSTVEGALERPDVKAAMSA